ncbi:proline-rich protein 2-like [Meles meles]|uniref:proline-rich protein 2-like n=1 Tax=Meles meles TaxID=9662 RepID=UPI001E69ECBF|nr:proline-rich protein 2-like [Meles meles]
MLVNKARAGLPGTTQAHTRRGGRARAHPEFGRQIRAPKCVMEGGVRRGQPSSGPPGPREGGGSDAGPEEGRCGPGPHPVPGAQPRPAVPALDLRRPPPRAASPPPQRQRQRQRQQQPRWRRGPRVPGRTPAPRSAAQRRDPCGCARLRLGPAARRGDPDSRPSQRVPRRRPTDLAREAAAAGSRAGGRPPPAPGILRGPGARRALRHRSGPAPAGLPQPSPPLGPRDAGSGGRTGGGGREPPPPAPPPPSARPQLLRARPGGAA